MVQASTAISIIFSGSSRSHLKQAYATLDATEGVTEANWETKKYAEYEKKYAEYGRKYAEYEEKYAEYGKKYAEHGKKYVVYERKYE